MTGITSYFTGVISVASRMTKRESRVEKGYRAFPEMEFTLHPLLKASPETESIFQSWDGPYSNISFLSLTLTENNS